MKHRPNLKPLTERANVNKESYADFVKPIRAISPAFRPGPRQKRYDPNADEVIRFVREYQRNDLPYQSPAALKKRTVLPAIGIHGNGGEIKSSLAAQVVGVKTINSTADSGFEDRPGEPNETIMALGVIDSANDIQNVSGEDVGYRRSENEVSSFSLQLSKENAAPFDEAKSTKGRFTFADDGIQSFQLDRFLDNTTSNPVSMARFSNGVSRVAQLRRPRALPQLPPIARSNLQDRPSAPSPTFTPPDQRSSIDEEENSFLDDQ